MGSLALRFIGSPRVERDGAPVWFDNRKALALLAVLAAEGHAQRRESLATLLWPDADQAHARGALRRVLASIKTAVGEDALEVHRESLGLRLGARGLWIDLARFARGVAACRGHGHTEELCPPGRDAITEALAVYRGDFLAGLTLRDSPEFDAWQSAQAESLRAEALRALERLVRHEAAQGRREEAATHARRWASLDPLSEAAHRHLMQLYAGRGERGRALRQYQECVRVLDAELGTAPSPETTRLWETIRAGSLAPTAAPPSPPASRPGPPFVFVQTAAVMHLDYLLLESH
jgi:DNA-binding SARP family transcriptional activator